MKSLINPPLTLAAIAFVTLSGCATQEKSQMDSGSNTVADCVFPDAPTQAAPGWICYEPVNGAALTGVGAHESSSAGVDFTKQMATANARLELSQRFNTHVKGLVKNFVETNGTGDMEAVNKVSTVVSEQITEKTLEGSRILKTRVSPSGVYYVLVGLSSSQLQTATDKVINASIKNNRALFEPYLNGNDQNELTKQIAGGGQ
jgi:hypothetical protein